MIFVLCSTRFLKQKRNWQSYYVSAKPGPKLTLGVHQNVRFKVAEIVVEVVEPFQDGAHVISHPGGGPKGVYGSILGMSRRASLRARGSFTRVDAEVASFSFNMWHTIGAQDQDNR